MALTLKTTIQRRPLWFFFPLAFFLSWYTWYLRVFGVHTSGGMNPLGVLLAGLIMSWICGGRGGVKLFLGRIVRVRVAPRWYLVAVLLPAGVVCAAAVLNLATLNSIGVGAVFPLFSGPALTQLWRLHTLCWVIAAAVIVWRSGPGLHGL
jgi:hypothetical protein